jgi:hypothetical protein
MTNEDTRAELIWAAAFADKFRSCIEAVIVNIGGAGRDTSMTRTETCAAIASQHADHAVAAYMATTATADTPDAPQEQS